VSKLDWVRTADASRKRDTRKKTSIHEIKHEPYKTGMLNLEKYGRNISIGFLFDATHNKGTKEKSVRFYQGKKEHAAPNPHTAAVVMTGEERGSLGGKGWRN